VARPKRAEQVQELGSCDVEVVDIGRVRMARAALPDVQATHALAALFGALGDPTRLRIVAALAASELCVCDLAAAVGLTSSAASHQLRVLRSLRLVRGRREGRMVFYALDDEHVRVLLREGSEHIAHRLAAPA
jgi:DNA-binding transcriptional ArsR family regulator